MSRFRIDIGGDCPHEPPQPLSSGRLTGSRPAIQELPRPETETARRIREAFAVPMALSMLGDPHISYYGSRAAEREAWLLDNLHRKGYFGGKREGRALRLYRFWGRVKP
jgi:hypothetical protein